MKLGFVNGDTTKFHTCLQKSIVETTANNLAKPYTANSHKSAAAELSNIKKMIARKVDVILLQPVDASALQADIEAANKAKIPIVLISLQAPEGSNVYAEVRVPLHDVGRLDAEWVNDDAQGSPVKAGVISGYGNSASDLMAGGFTENVASNVHVVASAPGMFNEEKSRAAAAEMIAAHPDLQYVFVANEEGAFGAREAFDDAGAQHVKIVTVNGTDEALIALRAGKFAATVSNSASDMGALAVTNTLALLRHDKAEKVAYLPIRLTTKGNAGTAPLYCPYK
ncbi:sugar ABC transporter substrate-binding protein [Streptomyces nodosus]